MILLPSLNWRTSYRHDDGDLVSLFYIPALSCAVQYDRLTGYFSADALALAARGIENLIFNGGRMRLVVGCTLEPEEIEAMSAGYAWRQDPQGYIAGRVVEKLARMPMEPPDPKAKDGLAALAWLIANNLMDVKVAVPVDPASGRPVSAPGIYHEKVGVIKDLEGNKISFSGSINETQGGWLNNRESFHVHCSWEGGREWKHVEDEVGAFERLWANKAQSVMTVPFPEAEKQRLLDFLPNDDRFNNRRIPETPEPPMEDPKQKFTLSEMREMVWTFIQNAARLENGIRVGEATAAVTPWPHQQQAFVRMWGSWPVRMLESSEVGLGKTTIAALLLRQLWLAQRVTKVLILVPKALMTQWVAELYEKFGLHVPIFDGKSLQWKQVVGYGGPLEKEVGRRGWLEEPIVIASSHLMRRRDRAEDLLSADGWDLVILDEAHHARRRGAGTSQEKGPNAMLALMEKLSSKTKGLLLLTATPMQVHPVEIYDLLRLLGLPDSWDGDRFVKYFEVASKPNPSNEELAWLASMFRETEKAFGEMTGDEIALVLPAAKPLTRNKIMKALRDKSSRIPLKQLSSSARTGALQVLRRYTPVRARMSRYTRALLRKYHAAGLIKSSIPHRVIRDRHIEMSKAERELYNAMEEYISTTYNAAAKEQQSAVGFILTVYRRRLASCVDALRKTLIRRLEGLIPETTEEDLPQNEILDEILSPEEAEVLANDGLKLVEADDIKLLLKQIEKVGTETKAKLLVKEIQLFFEEGYDSAIIFTQYTDTMMWLAEYLADELPNLTIGTYAGTGGSIRDKGGSWSNCTKEQVKLALKNKKIKLLVATDAAAEGLNLQFCGVLVNYDLPWNPMKVEQRIGRIDRIGQIHDHIVVLNLGYKDTVEADVYFALGNRINLFEGVVGKLQPILSRLPKRIEEAALARPETRDAVRQRFLSDLENEVAEAESAAFDIDEVSIEDLSAETFPEPPLTCADMEFVLGRCSLLSNGWDSKPLDPGSFAVSAPGLDVVRVTARPDLFEDHPESMAFFTPGGPMIQRNQNVLPDGILKVHEDENGHIRLVLRGELLSPINTFQEIINLLSH